MRQEDSEGQRLGKLEAERRLARVLPEVPERTIDSMLRELRTVDRDRDRVLPASQVANIVKKYQLSWINSSIVTLINVKIESVKHKK